MNPPEDKDGRVSILVIRTGPIGDFVQSLGAFSAIRMHHAGAEITVVANSSVVDFATAAPYFDRIETDPGSILGLRSIIRSRPFVRVYDLDTSKRTGWVFTFSKTWRQLMGHDEPVPWSGTAKGCSLPHQSEERLQMHTSDRLMSQLESAGILEHPPVSLAWVSRAVGTFSLPISLSEPFVLMAVDPGGANQTQWTPARFADMAEIAFARGQRPVLVGEQEAPDIAEAVKDVVSESVDLCGKASHVEVVFLSWAAVSAVGTDNGTMHLIATAGCKSVVLYDPGSDAALSGHRGPDVTILRRHNLASITAAEVVQALKSGTSP